MSATVDEYAGYEQGNVCPAKERDSLRILVSRGCSWNRCTFCPVYKGKKITFRPVEHVLRDIDALDACIQDLRAGRDLEEVAARTYSWDWGVLPSGVRPVAEAASTWFKTGMGCVFLQDGDALFVRLADVLKILHRLRDCFPEIRRITSYARSSTILKMPLEDLMALRQAGLCRLHVGIESGSDTVLGRMKKGVTAAEHIEAGRKIKEAGIELFVNVIVGGGGKELSNEHAVKTAEVLNAINPDCIELRTLLICPDSPLSDEWEEGLFDGCSEVMNLEEIRFMISQLIGITSTIDSNFFFNVLCDVNGRLPEDHAALLSELDAFLALDAHKQRLFIVGRRLDLVWHLEDLEDPVICERVESECNALGITSGNLDEKTRTLLLQNRLRRPYTGPARQARLRG